MDIAKFTLFIGLNDKDSRQQGISTVDAYKIISNMIAATFDGGTISEATGIYKHQDGTFTTETTLRVEILFASVEQIKPFVAELKKVLNQTTMGKYNYLEAVTADVVDYINENGICVTSDNRDEIEQQLNDELFVCDSVTGNASGSYTFSTWQAEENLCHNLDLLAEACEEFGGDAAKLLNDGAEACDVTIRCFLLGQAIAAALDEVETEEEEETSL